MDSRVGGGAGRHDAGGKLTSVVRAVDVMTPSGSDKGHGATLPNRLAGAPAAWEIDAGVEHHGRIAARTWRQAAWLRPAYAAAAAWLVTWSSSTAHCPTAQASP